MKNTVRLTLTGRQRTEEGEETITETCYTAEYYERNGSIYILYEEIPEGMATAVQSRIKLKGSVLEMTKRGAVSTRMVFEAGREYLTDYATPYGSIQIGIHTEQLEYLYPENGSCLRIQLRYTLTSQGQPFACCFLTITADLAEHG